MHQIFLGSGSSNPSPLGGTVSPVSNGNNGSDQTNTRIPLNAAEIMAAASAAVSKQKQGNSSLSGGKIRLNSASTNSGPTPSGSKFQASSGNKASGGNIANTSNSKNTNGTNSTHSTSGSSDNSNISTNGNGDNTKVSKLSGKNGCSSGGSGGGNGGKDSDKHRGDKNRGGGSSASTNKAQEPPSKKQKVRNTLVDIILEI